MPEPAIALSGVGVRFGSRAALVDVTADLPVGTTGLLGRNGAGKTTLLRVLAHREPRFTGHAALHGARVQDAARTPGLVHLAEGTWRHALDQDLRTLGRALSRLHPHYDADRAAELLDRFEVVPTATPRALSRGRATAAHVALALATRASITLLDEPQAGLDAPSRDLLATALVEEQAEHPRTFVISTHLIDETAPLFERVLVLDAGRVVAHDDVDALAQRWVRLTGDPARLEALPHAGAVERLGGRATAIVPADAVPADLADRAHPLTLQALAGALRHTHPED